MDFVRELAKEYSKDNSALVAAAVSFYVFLSLVPLLILGVAVLGFVLRSQQHVYQTIDTLLVAYSPALAARGGAGIEPVLLQIIHGSSAATGFGIIALLWAGSQSLVTLEQTINMAWHCSPRGFIMRRIVAIVLVIAVGILFVISFGITLVANAIVAHNFVLFGHNLSALFGTVWRFVTVVLPLLVSIATFTLIYKVIPNCRAPLRAALVGGIVAGVLWEIAKHIFSWYVAHFSHYNAIYGSLGGVIVLLVWIYYSSVVTLVGAQTAAIYHARKRP